MMVKKTCRNKLTALIKTASRYSHASPDMLYFLRAADYQETSSMGRRKKTELQVRRKVVR